MNIVRPYISKALAWKGLMLAVLLLSVLPCEAAKLIPVNPGESIQEAISRAEQGDSIVVFPGTYYENINLVVGVILKSKEGPEVTFINGSNNDAPVVKMAENSTLDGFTIVGRKIQGGPLTVNNSGHSAEGKGAVMCIDVYGTIKDNIIRNNQTSGISVSGEQASPMISGNSIFLNKGSGIGCSNQSAATITENEIYENNMAGIGIQHGSTPLVVDNKCYKNKMSGIGIRHKKSAPVIRSNKCYKNMFCGIGIEEGAEPYIENNEIYGNIKAGIGVKDASKASIVGNEIRGNTLSGIGIRDHSVVNISKNRIFENTLASIAVMDRSDVVITENDIYDNGTSGIVINNSKARILKNKVYSNTHHGISVHRGTYGEIAQNEIYDNGKDEKRGSGILVVSSSLPKIRKNKFSNNYGPGVYAHHCSPSISENVFVNDEILAKKHAGPIITKNVFYGRGKNGKKGKSGVAARNHSSPLIVENEFLGRFGVGSYKGSKPVIVGNLFSGTDESSVETGRSGIKIVSDSSAIILNNRFLNGNKISCRGLYLKDNPQVNKYEKGAIWAMALKSLGLTEKALKDEDVKKDIQRAARKQRRFKARRALSRKERKLKGVVIQGNLFIED